jgi:hypothetical protein
MEIRGGIGAGEVTRRLDEGRARTVPERLDAMVKPGIAGRGRSQVTGCSTRMEAVRGRGASVKTGVVRSSRFCGRVSSAAQSPLVQRRALLPVGNPL